jgi:hypothetical protein
VAGGGTSYVLPLRWSDDAGFDELCAYLRWLAGRVHEIVLVDASPASLFERHAAALSGVCRHLPPDPRFDFAMGKVNGVATGIEAAQHERVVIADDDVRYDDASLSQLITLLDDSHLVRPQNYFDPLPWHARVDTGRTLLNRVCTGDLEFPSGDFPGTLGLRRSAFLATGGYDGDVMFENLELMRTVAAAGGIVATPLDLYVRRLPPTARHYRSQRVRQAFDDLGVPLRMATMLAVGPAIAIALLRRRIGTIALGAAAVAGLAEAGRRRARGGSRYPLSSALLAPIWLLERAVSVWIALARRVRGGGIVYAGRLLPRGANRPGELRRRLGGVDLPPPGAPEGDGLVGPVAERVEARSTAAAEGNRAPA